MTPTNITTSSSTDITRHAFELLSQELQGHGNVLADNHRAALYELLETFTGYANGTRAGRVAFPLPTGMGKTSAVVAFIAAVHRLGLTTSLSVAASKVEALCNMKRRLLALDVPEHLIGLKHSVHGASLPSTDGDSRQFQLVTHSRVRSGKDFELFGNHQGRPRALCVYDETFMRCDAFAFRARSLFAAVAALGVEAEGSGDLVLNELLAYLRVAEQAIRAALAVRQTSGDPHDNGAPVRLPLLDEAALHGFGTTLSRLGGALKGFESELRDLVMVSQGTLWVVGSQEGEGIVTAREAVPRELSNVVILDASVPIRELARLDPTVSVMESFAAAELKSFEAVEVHQLLSPGGRSSIEGSLSGERREASAVAQEVARIIRAGWGNERAFLLFTYVRRGRLDMAQELQRDLARLGIDLEARTAEGQPRVNWLTWGQETSLNGLEHCTSVIMAGVLHRSHIDLTAMVKGQVGHGPEPTPSKLIRDLVESEIAHCIYQGASRGSCRRINDGKAQPMRLWFIHRSPSIKDRLDKVMPGAVWTYPEPQYLKKASADSKAALQLDQLLAHLRTLDEGIQQVSSRSLKEAMKLGRDQASVKTFSRACALLDLDTHGWIGKGRSLVRGAAAYGFSAAART